MTNKKTRHLISAVDFDAVDLKTIFGIARRVKQNLLAYRKLFGGKAMGLIFEKPSTRTWVSFDVGFSTMGGHVIYLGPDDIQLGVREEVRDVARVMARYLDAVVLRTFSHQRIIEFARYFGKPVINGLSNVEHPCQAIADLFTIEEAFGDLEGKKIAFVGDGNNVLNSIAVVAARLGVNVSYATPTKHAPSAPLIRRAKTEARKTKARIVGVHQPAKAVRGADVVYTDVWLSMGQESKSEKLKAFKGFQVNRALMKKASKGARLMHCLPAHRGEEITNDVLESKQSLVFDQAENRLHVQKAILIYLLGMASETPSVIE
jgi:ornithine carbamoyltransferase